VKTSPSQRRLPNHSLHYAWIVAAVTFVTLLLTAAIRATPSVLIVPFENEFRWTPASISNVISINLRPSSGRLGLWLDLRGSSARRSRRREFCRNPPNDRSRHPFRADNDVATAVFDRALLFASVWPSAGQRQEPNGTVAAEATLRLACPPKLGIWGTKEEASRYFSFSAPAFSSSSSSSSSGRVTMSVFAL
jgi:hypothetical protein